MVRYLTEDNRAPRPAPITVDRDVAELVPRAVEEVLRRAESWLAWDGRPTHAHGNVWTPHKALRRVTDHLIEHLAEVECRLAGAATIPDQWHGRRLTLDGDWARFTEADSGRGNKQVDQARGDIPRPYRRIGRRNTRCVGNGRRMDPA